MICYLQKKQGFSINFKKIFNENYQSFFHDHLQFCNLPAVISLEFKDKHITKYSLENMKEITASASEDGQYFFIDESSKKELMYKGYF